MLTLILILAIADVATGVYNAWVDKNLQSKVFKKGLATHIIAVIGCYGFYYYAPVLQMEQLVTPALISIVGMYTFSLIENYLAMGGTLPDFIAKHIKEREKGVNK